MIQSMLDNDLYTFTVAQAIRDNFEKPIVSYDFINRGEQKFNKLFESRLAIAIEDLCNLRFSTEELNYLSQRKFLTSKYVQSLKDFKFDSSEVYFNVDNDGKLNLNIEGDWHRTVYWEVPLLATISDLYFRYCDTDWDTDNQRLLAETKIARLGFTNCNFVDFGTRRRRNFYIQNQFVSIAKNYSNFMGTSNVHLAKFHNVKPIGTMSHQWIMGVSGIDGLRRSNKYALKRWADTYKGNLGIALTDTYGSDAFFNDFDGELARLYDGVRHDSGCPFTFGEQVIKHYEKLSIKPIYKTIVFSDGLDVDKAIELKSFFKDKIQTSFGIGTHFSNDGFSNSALKIVIKLRKIKETIDKEWVELVKLSDEPGKETGDSDACRVAKYIFRNEPL